MQTWLRWFAVFKPAQPWVHRREVALASIGAALGLALAAFISHLVLGEFNPWFIAPMGASSVLLFAVPASPLAQPWSMLGGNVVSAVAGVAVVQMLGHGPLAVGLAGGAAIAAMFALRCLHPPGGAVGLTAVLGGSAVTELGWEYVAVPVALNSALLLGMALLYSKLARRPYPHRPAPQLHGTKDPVPSARLGMLREDLRAVMSERGPMLDIAPDDLERILIRAQLHASRRKFGDVLCGDIMSRDVISVGPRDSVEAAWIKLSEHKIKALPVLRGDGTLAGIVSLHDFFLLHGTADPRKMPVMSTARYVQDIMTRRVRVSRPEQPMVDLVGLFSDGGLHHLPVVDADLRVIGMITQSDLVAALFRTGQEAAAAL